MQGRLLHLAKLPAVDIKEGFGVPVIVLSGKYVHESGVAVDARASPCDHQRSSTPRTPSDNRGLTDEENHSCIGAIHPASDGGL